MLNLEIHLESRQAITAPDVISIMKIFNADQIGNVTMSNGSILVQNMM